MNGSRNAPLYEDDFVAWLEDQAGRARRGETEDLDLENIAEELEGMARSDRREIRSRLAVLLTHLLKCATHSKRFSSGWLDTIAEQRDGIADLVRTVRACVTTQQKFSNAATRRRAAPRHVKCGCRKAPFPRTALSRWKISSTRIGCPAAAGDQLNEAEAASKFPSGNLGRVATPVASLMARPSLRDRPN